MHTLADHHDVSKTLSPRFSLRRLASLEVGLHRRGGSRRCQAESYISEQFHSVHAARVTHFLPTLLSVGDGNGFCSAAGLALASEGQLFSEVYLEGPAQRVISAMRGEPVSRDDIVEIGNLVSTCSGSSLFLFVILAELIARLGYRYAMFTATPEVERLLARLGFRAEPLVVADSNRLPDKGAQWGHYYERRPRVVYGVIQDAIAVARRDPRYRRVARIFSDRVEQVASTLHEQAA